MFVHEKKSASNKISVVSLVIMLSQSASERFLKVDFKLLP